MGGAHPALFPEVFENNPWIDYAMRGEADMAFLQFLPPLDPFYSILDKLWKGYCIKQRELPYKLTLKEYFSGVLAYFRSRYY